MTKHGNNCRFLQNKGKKMYLFLMIVGGVVCVTAMTLSFIDIQDDPNGGNTLFTIAVVGLVIVWSAIALSAFLQ